MPATAWHLNRNGAGSPFRSYPLHILSLAIDAQRVLLGLPVLVLLFSILGIEINARQSDHKFSVAIEAERIPSKADFIPVSCTIDFRKLLSENGISGTVDQRSLRLFAVQPDGHSFEIPYQFHASSQKRVENRELLPNTSSSVSYVAEYLATNVPSSIETSGTLTWILRSVRADDSSQFRLEFSAPQSGKFVQVPYEPHNLLAFEPSGLAKTNRWFAEMQIHPQWPFEGVFHFLRGSQPLLSYRIGPSRYETNQVPSAPRRPFLYPVYGPDGYPLTEFGKPHDPTGSHAHHYSIWIAHNSINHQDFWSERGGMILHEQASLQEDGPVFSRVDQQCRWVYASEVCMLESRRITAYATPSSFQMIDIDLRFSAPDAKPVLLGKTSFGFLAVRVAQSMSVFDGGGEIVNANGDINEGKAHLKRARWLDQSGPIASNLWNGIAILDYPGNPNHPTGWHCRNDGWAGASFNLETPYSIEPGKPLKLRYRLILHRGNAREARIDQRFEEFSAQPVIKLGKVTRVIE